jgi:hypothetical protein
MKAKSFRVVERRSAPAFAPGVPQQNIVHARAPDGTNIRLVLRSSDATAMGIEAGVEFSVYVQEGLPR